MKPFIGALLLPPAPLLLLVLAGAGLLPRRRALGWALVLCGCAGLWMMHTVVAGHWLQQWGLRVPPVLADAQVQALRGQPDTVVLVLGGGRSPMRQEYGRADLHPRGIERLRYGAYLARRSGLPLAYSGGIGWGAAAEGESEAEIAARVLQQEFNLPLQWQESQSRDTRENAERSVPLLRSAGIRHIVLVTHDYHMPRAQRAFEQAIAGSAEADGGSMRLTPAPMGVAGGGTLGAVHWLPSFSGAEQTRLVLHELIGRLLGA